MAILISVLALLAMFYQAYLQRVHNKRSLKPLGQIVLEDRQDVISVHVRNNGLGPLIIEKLTCIKGGTVYTGLEECLELEPRSYMRPSFDDSVTRVVLPNSSLTVFEACLKEHESEAELDRVRNQLSPITLKVEGQDIYDNKVILERDFHWFSRHMPEVTVNR